MELKDKPRFVNGISSDKKLKQIAPEYGFIHKLMMKLFSNLSNIRICYYSKLPIPI